jgi:protein associated with RNAse G/E
MEEHRIAHQAEDLWHTLAVGQEITVVKRSPSGDVAARYPATVVAREAADQWLALKAVWTYKRIEMNGLTFSPGDHLIEWFSPVQSFNAFAVISPEHVLRGWYANVTYPAYLESSPAGEPSPTLVWHDLYLDLVGLPDGTYEVLDEDELAESGLQTRDPGLHAEIVAANAELVQRFIKRQLPFRLIDSTDECRAHDRRQSQNESD